MMLTTEQKKLIQVDHRGRIWRVAIKIYNGRGRSKIVPVKPRRAEHNHGNYLRTQLGCKPVLAHRIVWEYYVDAIPHGLEINHLNGSGKDNRLENLELVTPHENALHAYRTGLNQRPRGANHPSAKLSEENVRSIRKLCKEGALTQGEIGKRFGVSISTVNHINTGRNWRSLC